MPKPIERDDLREMLEQPDTQLVEVLPQHEYEWAHLRGARNFPLRHLGAPQARALDARLPVVVYCHDAA
jgi:rhodanese-related sulfurtransferase